MRKNCSSDQENVLKFEAEGREFAKFLRSLEQFIHTVKGRNDIYFFEQNVLCIFDLTWIMNVKVRSINNFQFVHPNKILTIYRFWQCLKKNIGHQKSKQSFTFDFL